MPNAATSASYSFLLIGSMQPWRTPAGISYLFQAGTLVYPETWYHGLSMANYKFAMNTTTKGFVAKFWDNLNPAG